ncbi:MAG: NAD-dependent epimerase/dehydratase family protein [Paracoccaceae bacterium]|nr:NAD-dependent epimerase/dehydratase family protein [Paracoccaceae bacterium]
MRSRWPIVLPGPLFPVWQARGAVAAGWLAWDMLTEPYPGRPLVGGVVLNLAGVTAGDDLAANTSLALAACNAAATASARHVFLCSSAAVYGPGAGDDLHEDDPLHPTSAYGRAKQGMEQAARDWHAAQPAGGPGLTILRIGNVVGCDSLIGRAHSGRQVMLDPVPGNPGGPVRSYIGPCALANILMQLCRQAVAGDNLPEVLNICADPPVAMADLLSAAGIPWRYGPPAPQVISRVVLSTARLRQYITLPVCGGQAQALIDDWRKVDAQTP